MTTRRELAVKMLAAGRRYRDVAGVTGLAVNTVASYARLALRDGTLVRRSRNAASLLAGLPADVRDWLAAETPPGATVEQVVIAIILDAYAEDTAATPPLALKERHRDDARRIERDAAPAPAVGRT